MLAANEIPPSKGLLKLRTRKIGATTNNGDIPAAESDSIAKTSLVSSKGLAPSNTQQPTQEGLLRSGLPLASRSQSSSTSSTASTFHVTNDSDVAQSTNSKAIAVNGTTSANGVNTNDTNNEGMSATKYMSNTKHSSSAKKLSNTNGTTSANGSVAPTVEFIARTHTSAGPLEISISPSSLVEVDKLTDSILQYVTWKDGDGKNVPVTFEHFQSIFALGRSS
jgi:hypothetical protein